MKKIVVTMFIFIMFLFLGGCSLLSQVDSAPGGYDEDAASIPEKSAEEKLLNSLTTEEKIGQMLMIGFKEGATEAQLEQWIKDYKIGGFILFNRNYADFKDLFNLTNKLQKLNNNKDIPLFISSDEEGKSVSRLPPGKADIPDARNLGRVDDLEKTRQAGRVIGIELSVAGVNMDLAPVLDIVENKNNKILYKRSFGGDPQLVAKHGLAFSEGLSSAGVIPCVKHFPGHGDTREDSHKKVPVINISEQTWWSREAEPFRYAVEQGIDVIMVGHLSFPNLDSSGDPATKSKIFLQDILREKLGYQGIIITDDLEMGGFVQDQNIGEGAVASVTAGCDMLLICHTSEKQLAVFQAIKKAVEEGQITQERLDESVLRILKVKAKFKNNHNYDLEEANNIFKGVKLSD